MKLPFRLLVLPAVISVLTLQLSGCGEGGSNLADPVAEQLNTITTCDNKEDLCTSGQFVDEPVVGLNYSCNQVKGLTDSDGFFSCPNNSVVTFYLQSEKGKFKIILGSYLLKAVGSSAGTRQNTLIQVTPSDIVAPKYAADPITGALTPQITNLLRLLQAMDSDGYNDKVDVLNRIVITDQDKDKIDTLGLDLNSSTMADTESYNHQMEKLFAKIGRTLPTVEAATTRYNRSLVSLQSGVYEVSPFIFGLSDTANNRFFTGMVGQSASSNEKAFEGLFFILDREAKLIGTGMEWRANISLADSSDTLLQKVLFDVVPKTFHFDSQDIGFQSTGKVKPNFKLVSDTNNNNVDNVIEITQGVMAKGNLLGNDYFYRNAYSLISSDTVPEGAIGKWKRTGDVSLDGTVNMSKTRNVSPALDAAIWKTKENDLVPIFPLHLKLTFTDSDTKNCTNGCNVGPMGISILANGNIISDVNNNCRAVTNMMEDEDPSSTAERLEEHRLGMISAVFNDKNFGAAISPIILVDHWAKDHPTWGRFYGTYMGMLSFAGGPKVQINIANVRKGIVSIQNQNDTSAKEIFAAKWVNYPKFMTAYSTTPIEAQNLAVNQAQGNISAIEVQPCNAFLK